MITREQAIELRQYLIQQLDENGFREVSQEVNIRLEENLDEDDFSRSEINILDFYLDQTIDVLEAFSNSNFDLLTARLREFVRTDRGKIETIRLQPAIDAPLIDLRNLPDYREIIAEFRNIQSIISSENNPNDTDRDQYR